MLLSTINLDKSQWDTPLKLLGKTDLHLYNPYSPVVCWLLYLYSMEMGNPALYLELNRVSRDKDQTFLKQLGPFAKALFVVCTFAEEKKENEDRILSGDKFNSVLGNLAGCFLLWRGAPMK